MTRYAVKKLGHTLKGVEYATNALSCNGALSSCANNQNRLNAEARELEERISENVVMLLEEV